MIPKIFENISNFQGWGLNLVAYKKKKKKCSQVDINPFYVIGFIVYPPSPLKTIFSDVFREKRNQ